MAKKKDSKNEVKLERQYNVPLRKGWLKSPLYKRSKKAISTLKIFLAKHMKTDIKNIRIGPYLNEKIWTRGIRFPPHHVKVNAKKDDKDIVTAELVGAPIAKVDEKAAKKAEIEKKLAEAKKAKEEKTTEKTKESLEQAVGGKETEEKEEKPKEEEKKEEVKEAPKEEVKEAAPKEKPTEEKKETPKKEDKQEASKPAPAPTEEKKEEEVKKERPEPTVVEVSETKVSEHDQKSVISDKKKVPEPVPEKEPTETKAETTPDKEPTETKKEEEKQ